MSRQHAQVISAPKPAPLQHAQEQQPAPRQQGVSEQAQGGSGKLPSFDFGSMPIFPSTLSIGSSSDAAESRADQQAFRHNSLASPFRRRQLEGLVGSGEMPQLGSSGARTAPREVTDEIQSLLGQGQPLAGLAGPDASAMGVDTSGVSLHTDATADRLSQTLNARAFTVGSDIFFRRDAFAPSTAAGRHILLHELSHVQSPGSGPPSIHCLDARYTVQWLQGVLTEQSEIMLEFYNILRVRDRLEEFLQTEPQSGLPRQMARFNLRNAVNGVEESDAASAFGANIAEWQNFKQAVLTDADPVPQQQVAVVPPVAVNRIPEPAKPDTPVNKVQQQFTAWRKLSAQNDRPAKLSAGRKLLRHCLRWQRYIGFQLPKMTKKKTSAKALEIDLKLIQQIQQKVAAEHYQLVAAGPAKQRRARKGVHVDMGQGATGHLDQVVLISSGFFSCLPVVLYNSATGMGGLFHVSSGIDSIKNQLEEIQIMAKHIGADWIFVARGSQGSEQSNVQLLTGSLSGLVRRNRLQVLGAYAAMTVTHTGRLGGIANQIIDSFGNMDIRYRGNGYSAQYADVDYDLADYPDGLEVDSSRLPANIAVYSSPQVEPNSKWMYPWKE